MSRSEEILKRFQGKLPVQQPQPEQQDEYVEQRPSPLAEEYDKIQSSVQDEIRKEQVAINATNPHVFYTDIINNPSPAKSFPMRIMGRPIDLAALENYVVFKVSPRAIVTSMRYNDVRTTEDTLNYSKRALSSHGRKKGFPWILILVLIGALGIGAFLLLGGGNMTEMFQGFMP